ncbi:hypothetical protein [Vibrio spartinae]|uniref:Uncharacterized protein n=1 Tax=Vibrio spartinae TaxID=1918945 RepID=A0A1N6M5W2_9VIBR|nr:hypothetical protein [Vibrio spartinae]SIO94770.1 hypothetical protein VSP9026_02500 [Vibrio spartinae]
MENPEKQQQKSGGFLHLFTELSVIQSIVLTAIAVLFPTFKSVDLLSQVKILDFDGLLLYQGAFALLAVISAFLILYMISILATADKACTTFKKYLFYTATCLMIFTFSLSLREFYAPTSSFTSYFVGKELKVNYSLVQVESGLEFEVVTCSRSGQLVKCELKVTNKTEDDMNVTRFDRVSLYDQNNHRGKREKVIFDNQNVGRWESVHLTKKSSSDLAMYFNMSEKSASKMVKKLAINFNYFGNDRLVTFRNLELESAL